MGPYRIIRLSCGKSADVVGPGAVEVRFHGLDKPMGLHQMQEVQKALNQAYNTGVEQGRRQGIKGAK